MKMDHRRPPADSREVNAVTRTLAVLRAQAAGLRAQIAVLRQELADAQHALAGNHGTELIEANSQLVVSALHAEMAAETASSELRELTRSSQRDALTDTPNRALMLDRLQRAVALARRRGTRAAVLFLDLDRFKQINDSLGHAAGDAVLQLVAKRLSSVLRDSDTVSRHSGDEFLVLLAEVAEASDAALAATKMLRALAEPTLVAEHMLHLSASVGIAIYPDNGTDALTLIMRADAAMYWSKQRGSGGFAFYREEAASDAALVEN